MTVLPSTARWIVDIFPSIGWMDEISPVAAIVDFITDHNSSWVHSDISETPSPRKPVLLIIEAAASRRLHAERALHV